MKKRILSILLAVTLGLALFAPAAAADEPDRGSLTYEQIIAPQYEDAGLFSEGLAAVKKNGKWGYIDENNRTVIPFVYDVANPFSEGYAVVGKYGTAPGWDSEPEDAVFMGVIDKSGNYKPFRSWNHQTAGITDHYIYTSFYETNRSYMYYGGWVYADGLFDTNGSQFKTFDEYYDVYPSHMPTEGLVPVWAAGEDGSFYLDMNGNIDINYINKYSYYDGNWNLVSDWEDARYYTFISDVLPFNQGLAPVYECTLDMESWEYSYKFGFIDKSGDWVIQPQFDNGGFYVMGLFGRYQVFADNGLASVSKGGKYGAIDKTGRVVIPFQYDELWSFFEGLAVFCQNGKYGYVDSSGNVVIPAQFVSASGFSDGCAVVYDGSKAYLIDRYGYAVPGSELLDPATYFKTLDDGSVVTYTPGEYVTITSGGKYGFGRISYLPPLPAQSEMDSWAYDEVVAAIENDLVPASLQNMYRNDITREEFSRLVMQAMCAILDTDPESLVQQKTGRSLTNWIHDYPFRDAANSDIAAAYALGVVTGYGDGTFQPYSKISRQEAAVMLTRAAKTLGMDTASPQSAGFADRGQIASWAASGVDYVFQIGVMNGVGGNAFSPQTNYTRQQSFMTVYRLLLALIEQS